MDEQKQFLAETLQTAVALVDTIDQQYRVTAFPIILQSLINGSEKISNKSPFTPGTDEQEGPKLRLPPNMSVNEFFVKTKSKTHLANFVCAAYYLFHTGKAEEFTVADILTVYSKLRIGKPRNPSDVLGDCLRKAFFADGAGSTNKQKLFVITPSGENYVEDLLHGTGSSN